MRSRTVCVWLAVVALLASSCSTEEEITSSTSDIRSPTTATTAPAVTDASGAQALAWTRAFDVPDPFNITSIVWTEDRFYALGTDWEAGLFGPSVVWTSVDGIEWTAVDPSAFGQGATVQSLTPTDDGVLALGFLPDSGGHAATAWFSSDATGWQASDMGYLVGPATQPFTTSNLWFGPAAAGPAGSAVTATAFPVLDWTAAQEAAVRVLPDYLDGIDPHRVGTTPESVLVNIGPFTVFSESLDSMGLDELEEAQRITNSPTAMTAEEEFYFYSADLETWDLTDEAPVRGHISTLITMNDEYLLLSEEQIYASDDGQVWTPVGDTPEGLWGLFRVGERLITDGWRGDARVTMISEDAGHTWQDVAGPGLTASWISAAGPAGVLATGTDDQVGWGAMPEPATIEVDGYTIAFDEAAQEFTVADVGGTIVLSSSLMMEDPMWGWGYTPPDEMIFDYRSEMAQLVDPTSGEPLLTVTFDELDLLAEGMVWSGGELLAFSPEGDQWTVSPVSEAFGPHTMLGAACVGADRVVAVVRQALLDPSGDEAIWVGVPVAGQAVATAPIGPEPPQVVMGGPPLTWDKVLDLDEEFTSMVATERGLWAIAGDWLEPDVLWHSIDGTEWTQRDIATLFGEGAVVQRIIEGGPGLVAAGFRPSGSTQEAVTWTSADGERWDMSPLGFIAPEPEGSYQMTRIEAEHLAVSPTGAVVVVSSWESMDYGLLEPNVQSALPGGLREYATGMGVMIDPWNISVSIGPFQVFSEAVDDLDVDQELFDVYGRATGGTSGPSGLLFVTDDYRTWRQVEDWPGGDQSVCAMTGTPDGFLADLCMWGAQAGPLASADGVTWVETELPADPGSISWLGDYDGRQAMAGQLKGSPVLWALDGTTWDVWTGLPANAWEVRVGGSGLVAWGEQESEWWDPLNWEPTVVESGGFIMTVNSETGGLLITDTSGAEVVAVDLLQAGFGGPEGMQLPDFIVADNENGLFTVANPDTGETLMTVPYRDMQDAFEAGQPGGFGPNMFVSYSSDGQTWSEEWITELTGTTGWVQEVAVGADFVVMVVSGLDHGTSIWRGTLP